MLFIKDKNKYNDIIKNYCNNINDGYLDNIISDSKSKLLVYCINGYFSENNIIGFIIYVKSLSKSINNYYILLCGINKEYREYGYGNCLLTEFEKFVKLSKSKYRKKIILHSLDDTLNFYTKNNYIISDLIYKTIEKYEGKKTSGYYLIKYIN
ncbi:GNAT family N-acetyltransferase [bacterium]|nr:GNAT family N-acetyltransferase [bacterium]